MKAMRDRRRLAMGLLVASIAAGAAVAARQPPPVPQLSMRVPVPPAIVPMAGQRWLIYELHLENLGSAAATLTSLEIAGNANLNRPLTGFAREALARRLDAAPSAERPLDLPAGARRVVYLEIALPPGPPPTHLHHHLRFTTGTSVGGITGGVPGVPVDATPPVVLSAPLAGGPWAAIHHPDWERGHRRVFYTVDGTTRLPGRYTIDFVKLDAQGHTTQGDADLVANALGYGAAVLAVADATVAATRDSIPEVSRISERRKHPEGEAAGNYVSLDLGNGAFAVYEHVRPGSVTVTAGQRVKRGDVIAQIGFTGDSTGPHLHLHVGTAAAPLAAEGLAFVFTRFVTLGHYRDIAALDKEPWDTSAAELLRAERPGPNTIIEFPADGRFDRLPPADEAAKCEGFTAFRDALLRIVSKRDAKALLSHVDRDIELSDRSRGQADFQRTWLGTPEQRETLWSNLGKVLRLGGRCETPTRFVASYVHTDWPDELDTYSYLAVVGDAVPLRTEPRADAAVVRPLDRAIVFRTGFESFDSPWFAVEAPDGGRGFVNARLLQSPLGMRAWFARSRGVWRVIAWFGGD
jgi:murein DD-endopeptidase